MAIRRRCRSSNRNSGRPHRRTSMEAHTKHRVAGPCLVKHAGLLLAHASSYRCSAKCMTTCLCMHASGYTTYRCVSGLKPDRNGNLHRGTTFNAVSLACGRKRPLAMQTVSHATWMQYFLPAYSLADVGAASSSVAGRNDGHGLSTKLTPWRSCSAGLCWRWSCWQCV